MRISDLIKNGKILDRSSGISSKSAAISMGDSMLKGKIKKELEKSKILDSMINSIIRDFSAGILQDPFILQNKYPGIGTNTSENIMAILRNTN
jgi:hypothetical protein